MTDHWIRVHPEQGIKSPKHDESLRSQIQPLREFLRIIVTDDARESRSGSSAACERRCLLRRRA